MTPWRRIRRWLHRSAHEQQSAATDSLQNAWTYIRTTRWNCASTQERERLMPHDQETLDILHRLAQESMIMQEELA